MWMRDRHTRRLSASDRRRKRNEGRNGGVVEQHLWMGEENTKKEVTGTWLNMASGYETVLSGCGLPNGTKRKFFCLRSVSCLTRPETTMAEAKVHLTRLVDGSKKRAET